MRIKMLFVKACILSAVSTPLSTHAGNVSLDVLDIPMGIRNIAMGATGVSDMSVLANGYYNPASVVWQDGATITFGYHDLGGDTYLEEEAAAKDWRLTLGRKLGSDPNARLRLGAVLGYTDLNYEFTALDPFSENHDYYLTGGLGLGWNNGTASVAGGATGKYAKVEYADSHLDVWLLDLGLTGAFTHDIDGASLRTRAGLAITNQDNGITIAGGTYDVAGEIRAGGGIDWRSRPRNFASQSVSAFGISADVDFHNPEFGSEYWGVGLELSAFDLLQLRGGLQKVSDIDYGVQMLGGGIGWDFGTWMVRADYARFMPDIFGAEFDRNSFGASIGADF